MGISYLLLSIEKRSIESICTKDRHSKGETYSVVQLCQISMHVLEMDMLNRWILRLFLRWSWFLSASESMSYEAYRWWILDGYSKTIWKITWNNGWTYHFTDHQWLAVFMWYESDNSQTYIKTMDILLDNKWKICQY